ncbi:hypothetical protein DAPK24_012240 [Pichia kluyveri]|uniref:Uncharacterized protein n=1 Tax=Pichia kluyveri TaxID=36015 RepID=A0AAV5QZL5_PICKL|nr:hypothetical protein DAPK24_012240 [Pichia kluyveri]
MVPITDIVETVSFGLVSKLRKKTHIYDDHVQTIKEKDENSIDFNCKHITKKMTKSSSVCNTISNTIDENFNRHNSVKVKKSKSEEQFKPEIITAAYTFNNSLPMIQSQSSSSFPSYDSNHQDVFTRSKSLNYTSNYSYKRPNAIFSIHDDDNNKFRESSKSLSPTRSSIPIPKHSSHSMKDCFDRTFKTLSSKNNTLNNDNINQSKRTNSSSTLTNSSLKSKKSTGSTINSSTISHRRVTIADNVTDMESGEKLAVNNNADDTNTRKSHSKNLQYNVYNDGNETDNSSFYSFSEQHQFKLVLDDHITPEL